MNFNLNFDVDRITITQQCMKEGKKLIDLKNELEKITGNVRTHYGDQPRLEVFFNANDLDNYEFGFEAQIQSIIWEFVDHIEMPTAAMRIIAAFDQPA